MGPFKLSGLVGDNVALKFGYRPGQKMDGRELFIIFLLRSLFTLEMALFSILLNY